MQELLVHSHNGDVRLGVPEGLSVREVLDTTPLRVRAACGGTGTCGACLVRVVRGEISALTLADYLKLSPEERDAGIRLACQLRLHGPTEIRLEHPAPPSPWRSLVSAHLTTRGAPQPGLEHHPYGLAVDLGTTHIRIALWDRRSGQRIATRHGRNPQADFGADVLNRLGAAHKHGAHESALSELARGAISDALRDILARDVGEVSPMLAEIGRVVIVGNSAMLALLSGHGRVALADPGNWQAPIDCEPVDRLEWHRQWHLPNAEIILAAPAGGFVGSDLLADVIATGLVGKRDPAMLVDIGTNTEIALWDGHDLHVTSVPGGPAFEGSGIRNGMAAEAGAIEAVHETPAGLEFVTIGNAPARAYCGSGLIDAIAVLLRQGIIKPSGRFSAAPGPDGHALAPGGAFTAITGGDIDHFQRAKASMAAAMVQLLVLAGLRWDALKRLCLCGAFGQTLDLANATMLGLLPPIDPAHIELRADASLAGCEQALLSPDAMCLFDALRPRIRIINLSQVAGYEDRYIEHLRLRPITPGTACAS